MPDKRAADARAQDFDEIYDEFAEAAGRVQAARCSQCGVPFCQSGCPLTNEIPEWLALAAEGRLRDAYEASAATNPMPEVCGRICPQDKLCEGACVVERAGHGTITIGAVERYLTETAWEEGWVPPIQAGPRSGRSVGIVGAGPAGLAAAEKLREAGHDVVIYDRYDRPGGLMIYGIPNFKLDKDVVIRRTDRLAEAGVAFILKTDVGRDLSLATLRERHDAVILATGVYAARRLEAPGAGAGAAVPALDFLITENRRGLGDSVALEADKRMKAHGKRVVVVGGGDTAMDCVRTAIRQGAVEVTCLYRRDQINMPGSAREVAHAQEEGVVFEWLAAPRALHDFHVRAGRMSLGRPDMTGRRRPEPVPESDFDLPADMVVAALGFEPEALPDMLAAPDLKTSAGGTVRVTPSTMATSLPGVFAAGDVVRGSSLVVWALKDGIDAAAGVETYLNSTPARAREAQAA